MRVLDCDFKTALRTVLGEIPSEACTRNPKPNGQGRSDTTAPHDSKPLSTNCVRATCERKGFNVVKEYYYADDLRKVRLEKPGTPKPEKTFLWERQKDGRWWSGTGGKPIPLYVNKLFRESDQIGLALGLEGEGKVDLAGELGVAAFSFKDLKLEHCSAFAGADLVLWPDKDAAGDEQVRCSAQLILASQCARTLRLITPPPELPASGDICDWFASGGNKERLLKLVEATPIFTAEDVASWEQTVPATEATGRRAENNGPAWPNAPAPEAYSGLAGDGVNAIEPHTEASRVALLIQFLVCFGNVVGRTAHFVAEASQHFTNLFVTLVGVTSVGRKGSSWAQVFRLFRMVDSEWAGQRIQSGLSSGEGLIWAVHDPTSKREPIKKQGRVVDYQEVEIDPGVSDKRLLVFESEFASPLRMMARDGNTLSVVIRQAWDTGDLRAMTKNSPAKATGALISIVSHITRDELRRELGATEMGNGFANRFLWVCTTRSKELPEGGDLADDKLSPVEERLCDAVKFARAVGEMKRDPAIKGMWAETYHELTSGRTGLVGAVTSRAEAQTMRLACLYALLDQSAIVRAEHLLAAVALWEYCQASARFIFGDALGDPTADTILQALRDAQDGLDRTAISSLFGRHRSAGEISRALSVLQEYGLATVSHASQDATGRPREVWFAVGSTAKKANEAKK